MGSIQIVNKSRGRHRASGQTASEAVSAEIETIARREAPKNGIDVNARNGLMAAIMYVMGRKELMEEAARAARLRLEKVGMIVKDDPQIVKQPGKTS
jgi:hypothetical protein